MTPKAKTWLWIIAGFVGVCLVGLLGLAVAGVYFVSHHIDTRRTTSADAIGAFEAMRTAMKDQRPLIEIDTFERPRQARQFSKIPTSPIRPRDLWILAWDPDEQRLVKVSLPFWLLRLGRHKMDLAGDQGFDLERLHLDVPELDRIGPTLVLDYRSPSGERVLIWTQ